MIYTSEYDKFTIHMLLPSYLDSQSHIYDESMKENMLFLFYFWPYVITELIWSLQYKQHINLMFNSHQCHQLLDNQIIFYSWVDKKLNIYNMLISYDQLNKIYNQVLFFAKFFKFLNEDLIILYFIVYDYFIFNFILGIFEIRSIFLFSLILFLFIIIKIWWI